MPHTTKNQTTTKNQKLSRILFDPITHRRIPNAPIPRRIIREQTYDTTASLKDRDNNQFLITTSIPEILDVIIQNIHNINNGSAFVPTSDACQTPKLFYDTLNDGSIQRVCGKYLSPGFTPGEGPEFANGQVTAASCGELHGDWQSAETNLTNSIHNSCTSLNKPNPPPKWEQALGITAMSLLFVMALLFLLSRSRYKDSIKEFCHSVCTCGLFSRPNADDDVHSRLMDEAHQGNTEPDSEGAQTQLQHH